MGFELKVRSLQGLFPFAKNTTPIVEPRSNLIQKGEQNMLEIIGLLVLAYFCGKLFVKGMRKESRKDREP